MRRKGFGRGDSDFGSGAGKEAEIRQSRYRRPHHVDDAEGFASLRLNEFERFDGVCRFARLRNENVERLGVDPYRAIEKFARDFGGGGHSGVFSKRVGSSPAGVVRGSARDELDALHLCVAQVLEGRGVEYEVFKIRAALEDRPHHLGLLVDFFQHEMLEIPLVGFEAFGFHSLERSRNQRSFRSDFVRTVRFDAHQIAVVEKRHLVGVSGEGLHVRGEEAFPGFGIASENQRASVFDADELSRKIRMHHQKGVRALESRKRRLDGFDKGVRAAGAQSRGGFFADEFGNDFRIRLAVEFGSGFREFFGEFAVILNDAVVHQKEAVFCV